MAEYCGKLDEPLGADGLLVRFELAQQRIKRVVEAVQSAFEDREPLPIVE